MYKSGVIALMLAAGACHASIVPFAESNVPITTEVTAFPLFVNTNDAIIVMVHPNGPFEFTISMFTLGNVELSNNIAVMSIVDGNLAYSSDDRQVWCMGIAEDCAPPYNGYGYYGLRIQAEDGTHYGWLETDFANLGWGIVTLSVVTGAYQSVPDMVVLAGVTDIILPTECGTADFNCDGDVGTDADITAFFACLSGTCPPCGSADFNGDGDPGTDEDINSFFRVLSGGHC